MRTRVISTCLFGADPMYHVGAVENARLVKVIYPTWTLRVYCDDNAPTGQLEGLGVDIRRCGTCIGRGGQKWRMLPVWDQQDDVVLFRDLDSRLNPREAQAVEEWLESGLLAHAMHDHRCHTSVPFLGGMWGLRAKQARIPAPSQEISVAVRMDDQRGLLNHVWPFVKHSVMRHVRDGVNVKWEGVRRRFTVDLPEGQFIGQQVKASGEYIYP